MSIRGSANKWEEMSVLVSASVNYKCIQRDLNPGQDYKSRLGNVTEVSDSLELTKRPSTLVQVNWERGSVLVNFLNCKCLQSYVRLEQLHFVLRAILGKLSLLPILMDNSLCSGEIKVWIPLTGNRAT